MSTTDDGEDAHLYTEIDIEEFPDGPAPQKGASTTELSGSRLTIYLDSNAEAWVASDAWLAVSEAR